MVNLFCCCVVFRNCFYRHRQAITANFFIVLFLIAYTLFGGFVFLHFEYRYAAFLKQNKTVSQKNCISRELAREHLMFQEAAEIQELASRITESCVVEKAVNPKMEWSFATAAFYGFGILTTLGYGKIEPMTTNGRIFSVIYGFVGIPITVILLTNLGRYLEILAMRARRCCSRDKRPQTEDHDSDILDNISPATLFFVVVFYLVFGAIFIPLLDGQFDFFNGLYFAFICLTAIEYGDLVPNNGWFVPVVIVYVCIGLAISTIALDIGSLYVRKLHYIGRKLRNFANVKIWFGADNLRVHELINAVGQNIGIEQSIISDIDLETLVDIAIQVKEGRLSRVPQTHMIVEGIWPPELVPLFIKEGAFPVFMDSEDELDRLSSSLEKPLHHKKPSVRFDDTIYSDTEDATLSSPSSPSGFHSKSRSSPTVSLPGSPPPPPPQDVTPFQFTLPEGVMKREQWTQTMDDNFQYHTVQTPPAKNTRGFFSGGSFRKTSMRASQRLVKSVQATFMKRFFRIPRSPRNYNLSGESEKEKERTPPPVVGAPPSSPPVLHNNTDPRSEERNVYSEIGDVAGFADEDDDDVFGHYQGGGHGERSGRRRRGTERGKERRRESKDGEEQQRLSRSSDSDRALRLQPSLDPMSNSHTTNTSSFSSSSTRPI